MLVQIGLGAVVAALGLASHWKAYRDRVNQLSDDFHWANSRDWVEPR